jgi:hypothetical protein
MADGVVRMAAGRDWGALGDDNQVCQDWAEGVAPAECSDDRAAFPAWVVAPVESEDDRMVCRAGAVEQGESSAALGRWDPVPAHSGTRRRA